MSDFFQAGQHPDADQLTAFVEHTLPKHEQQQTLAHLAECTACRHIVGLSLAPGEELPVVGPERRRFSGWRVAWGGVPLLATVLLVLLLVHQRNPGSRESAPAGSPQMVAHRAEPQVPLLQQKQRVFPARRSAPPAAAEMARNTPSGGGMMGGILGGIGTAPPRVTVPMPPIAAPTPLTMFASHRGGGAQVAPAPLPSGLATISIASRGNQRLAIDAQHTVFLSEDEGRNWRAVPSQWKGRAMRVALTTTAPAGDSVSPVTGKNLSAGPSGAIARAALSGTVTDPSGGAVPGATVTAFNSGNESSQAAVTDRQGHFQFDSLAAGTYRIDAEAPGFMKQSQAEVVPAAQPAVVNFTLKLGAVSQTVTVQTGSPSVDLLTSTPSLDLPPFELTSDDGGRWISADGQSWSRK